jgi:hypothetical protein
MTDDSFDLDLTNFEANHRWDEVHADDEGFFESAPWNDERGLKDLYTPQTLWKAKQLLLTDSHPEEPAVEAIADRKWEVSGSERYIVFQLEGPESGTPWLTCDCPNGLARGGRPSCYHTAAVMMLILGTDLTTITEPKKVGKR